MRLGRFGRRQETEAISEIRQDLLALDTQMRATIAEIGTLVEGRIRATVDQARAAGEEQLTDVLRQVGRSYELLAERINADKLERRALVDALANAARSLSAAVPKPRLIGGTIFGGGTELDSEPTDDMIALTAAERGKNGRNAAVEVRCRFGDRWVDGFEVADLVDDGESFRYRLRRQSDGSVLPTLFDACNVRRAGGPPLDEQLPRSQSPWSRLR